jgi:hypothetical protein
MCVPGRSWALTGAGHALAAAALPPPGDLDRRILAVLARTPAGVAAVARRIIVCSFTARRRVDLLVERGMVCRNAAKDYAITDAGRAVLGDAAPEPWLKVSAISAALA